MLDDSSKMPQMKILAREAMLHSKQLGQLAHYIITELFIFELDLKSVPKKENGRYLYTSYILCSCRASILALNALLKRLTKSLAKILFKGRILLSFIRDCLFLTRDGNFKKRVCFNVTSK